MVPQASRVWETHWGLFMALHKINQEFGFTFCSLKHSLTSGLAVQLLHVLNSWHLYLQTLWKDVVLKGIWGIVKIHLKVKDEATEETTSCICMPQKLRGSQPLRESAGLDLCWKLLWAGAGGGRKEIGVYGALEEDCCSEHETRPWPVPEAGEPTTAKAWVAPAPKGRKISQSSLSPRAMLMLLDEKRTRTNS